MPSSLEALAGIPVAESSRVGYCLPLQLDLIERTAAPGEASGIWLRRLSWLRDAGGIDDKSFGRLDVAAPLFRGGSAANDGALIEPFRLDVGALLPRSMVHLTKTAAASTSSSEAALQATLVAPADLQLHVTVSDLAVLSLALAVESTQLWALRTRAGRPPLWSREWSSGSVSVRGLLDLTMALRRLNLASDPAQPAAGRRPGPTPYRSVFLVPFGDQECTDATVAELLGSTRLGGVAACAAHITRWARDGWPGAGAVRGWLPIPAHRLAWHIIDWLRTRATSVASMTSAREDFVALCRSSRSPEVLAEHERLQCDALHDPYIRAYVHLAAPLGAVPSDVVLQRFALGESTGYGDGPRGGDGDGLVRTLRNSEHNAWGISHEGSVCLIQHDAESFFVHNLPEIYRTSQQTSLHLALIQRTALLRLLQRLGRFAKRFAVGADADVLATQARGLREAVMTNELLYSQLVVSTNPRQQLLYSAYRDVFSVPNLQEEIHREVTELDDWLDRHETERRRRVDDRRQEEQDVMSALLFALTVLLLPLNLLFAAFGMNIGHLSEAPVSFLNPWNVVPLVATAVLCVASLVATLVFYRKLRSGRLARRVGELSDMAARLTEELLPGAGLSEPSERKVEGGKRED